MTLGTAVLITTLLNPVETAENAATLAALTEGRFVLGAGLGYRPEEDAAFGVPTKRVTAFTEKLRVIRRLLDGEPVAQVAAGVGFHDQAHLTRHFRRHVGTTPARYAAASAT